jgi:hypothetical protein
LPKEAAPSVSGVAQHRPYHGAFPARALLTSWDPFGVEPARDLAHAKPIDGVHGIDMPYHARLGLDYLVHRGGLIALSDIPISVRGPTQHTHFAGSGTMTLAAAGTFHDLRPLVLRDHALELDEQLIFGARSLRCFNEDGLDTW